MSAPEADAFAVHRAALDTAEIAYLREGAGGYPLLLLHGWPETKRIWWRNVDALARAGFEVIVPDLRGFGESGLASDDRYDVAAHARDMEALVRGELGHRACVVCAGDLGGLVAQDLSLRFEGLVTRMVLFNTIPPFLGEEYRAAGIEPGPPRSVRQAADYFLRQSRDADALAAELDTPGKRRRYVAQMYGPRFWAAPGAFGAADVDFMTEPFGDPERFRASIANYEYAGGPREAPEAPRVLERNPTNDARPLRPGGPRDRPRIPPADGGGLPGDRRSVRGRGRRALPHVGASAGPQPGRGGFLPGPSERIAVGMSARPPTRASELAARQVEQIVAAAQEAAEEIRNVAQRELEDLRRERGEGGRASQGGGAPRRRGRDGRRAQGGDHAHPRGAA